MHLKTLTMKGFKSFADSVSVELERGVTVVVGPNGSGKSNVVDAIAWVLGAQAPSAVRSQKMDDVIFAGTAKRPALGRAEVSLTIDNSDGLLPTEFTELQITRTLFRNGDSEYSLNGVPCRLLDIQDLLSDSGVGRTQHVIVSQGQIDAVLNARPEERRLIIEEAAGVLKFRKRREKAQRRLIATEANLTRIQDLLREVRRQLRPLEKQADAARRHGDVVAELYACQMWLAGRQVDSLRKKMGTHSATRTDLAQHDRELREGLASLDAEIIAVEGNLSAQGAVDLGDALARLEGLSQRARGADDLMAERLRGLGRERQATIDADILAALRNELVQLGTQLEQVGHAEAEFAPELETLTIVDSALNDDEETFRLAVASTEEGGVAAAAGRASEVRGELSALRASVTRADDELATITSRLSDLDARQTNLATRLADQRVQLDRCVVREHELVEAADHATNEYEAGRDRLVALREARAEADAVHRSAEARATALQEALDSARAAAGVDALEGVPGVVGTILDVLVIESGWEKAVEAALGGIVAAIVVESSTTAREVLERFATDSGSGAVVALDQPDVQHAEFGPDSILHRISSPRPEVMAAARRHLAGIDAVDGDWRTAIDRSATATGRIIVTRHGDRIGGGLWQIGGAGPGATRAALDDARIAVESALTDRRRLDAEIDGAITEVDQAAHQAHAASAALNGNDAELTAITEDLHQVEAEIKRIEVEQNGLETQRSELELRVERETSRSGELETLLPALESAETESAERSRELEATRAVLAERRTEIQNQRSDLDVRTAALDERRTVLTLRSGEVRDRLERLEVEDTEAETRRVELDRAEHLGVRLRAALTGTAENLQVHLDARRTERREQTAVVRELTELLDSLRKQRADAEQELRETGERIGRIDIDEAETRLRLETTTEMLRRDLDTDPDGAVNAAHPELPEGVTPAARTRELERDLKIMGPINPLALQEFEALQERHEFLQGQLDDIRSTRRELNKVIRAIDEEIVTVFAAAYADVADNFETLFERLFPGGQGSLKLTEPDNLLETGIEVSAKPSGKNVKKLSLLSGGERSLTALAFLFAVFRSRPSPFYVMDEVEAALDDVNLYRFLTLVAEFRDEAQLVIVSHQKRTMESADSLYGVTMEPAGSSKVVSERSEVERSFGTESRTSAELAAT